MTVAQGEHVSAWRAVVAAPAAVGSVLVLVVLLGGLGAWEGIVVTGWIAAGPAMLTRRGERMAVRLSCRFRRATTQQMAVVSPLWAKALAIAQLADSHVDLYVRDSSEVNAFATGSRSVALTTGLISELQEHRLDEPQLIALMLHELGHIDARATRFALATAWWSAPWLLLTRLAMTLVVALPRRPPRRPAMLAGGLGAVLAIGQALDVPGHQVGSRLTGGSPPSALWRRRVL